MTKLQMNALLVQMDQVETKNKTEQKKLDTIMTALRADIAKGKTTDGPDKFISFDGTDYQWCNRHEVYEPLTNFKPNQPACKLAVRVWGQLTKQVNTAKTELQALIDAGDFDKLPAANEAMKKIDAIRGGKFDIEADMGANEMDDYNSTYVTLEDLA